MRALQHAGGPNLSLAAVIQSHKVSSALQWAVQALSLRDLEDALCWCRICTNGRQ